MSECESEFHWQSLSHIAVTVTIVMIFEFRGSSVGLGRRSRRPAPILKVVQARQFPSRKKSPWFNPPISESEKVAVVQPAVVQPATRP